METLGGRCTIRSGYLYFIHHYHGKKRLYLSLLSYLS